MDLYYAIVKNNDSTQSPSKLKNGSVQFFIPDLMDGITDMSKLPWALPHNMSMGGAADHGDSSIPEVNDLIWIYFEDVIFKKKAFYMAGINLKGFGPHGLFESNIKTHIPGFTSSYPDVKFQHYKNGVNIAVSSNVVTPEIAIYHPSGAYIFIDKLGKIKINANNLIQIKNPTQSMRTLIDGLINLLKSFSTTGSPVSHTTSPATQTLLDTEKAKWDSLLEE
jgi:hypothetical protein